MAKLINRKVLQVDNSYIPDAVIDMWRAVGLIWKGSAVLVEPDGDRMLHAGFGPVPSIIRLVRPNNKRRGLRKAGKQRMRIFIRDGFRCQYCSKKFQASSLTLDHIMPKSRGGLDEPENLATSCISCNQRKGNRTPDESRMPLLATPSALRYGLDKALIQHAAQSRPEWRPYLFLDPIVEKVAA